MASCGPGGWNVKSRAVNHHNGDSQRRITLISERLKLAVMSRGVFFGK